ncbi:EcoAI/FtnUII family type I restriction enzme subunit R [Methanosarcina mazei]|uniref:Restriction endonuclease subunit R n=2 Tax=Methanosarcina mazei TaxID=2209 RepID=A0A0F8I3Z8_METMZ|nr:type I restriction endonuclease subunit R [Methanosarcina mazei]AKB61531.1 Type I restriction-modification system, restriction subunit R [Methanosarcina mazei SarPi]KKG83671.1 restriction endonuclease subunit R [Methanosarcina mazei]
MNEAQTRAELIDPKLIESGWGVVEGSKILREYHLTLGRIQAGGKRAKPLIADYVLVYKDRKIAVIEAKSDELEVGEGVAQAKNYAEKLYIETTFSSNGKEIYQICMRTGAEGSIDRFPTPDELWNKTFSTHSHWRDTFSRVPFENLGGTKNIRYYQEIAVNNTMAAIAEEKQRILLTLATGTGKTFIAFQIAWKLFQTRWNLNRDGRRRPRILFLADRNILADQAFNDFSAFPEDALVRITPKEISKKGSVPTNGSIFFTIFQTFMSGPENTPYFGEYPADYFDFIIIDECHRGGANDESSWRSIMEYFSPAVQLGLTATPKRDDNVDTYKYFGEPVYIYSLKEGINDGFLTPFKVKRIKTTLDDYIYTPDDHVIEGEVEEGKVYTEVDFNKIIEIKEREAKRINIFLSEIDQREKAIVFCANQAHAAIVRDLINQYKDSSEPNYCVRVTANDGSLGEEYLRQFRDNENTIPTILTTSQKLSTGVDARNIRNIILMRPINSIIEFKQIIGRGTRLFDGKEYFTIYDFVNAYHHFADPEWDGEPLEPESKPESPKGVKDPKEPYVSSEEYEKEAKKKLKIKLCDGKEREIQHMISTSFWSADGKPISAQEFLQNLFGILPEFFKDENELRKIWSNPMTRSEFLKKLAEAGYGMDELTTLQKLIDAEKSDLFDVLEYVSFALQPVTRETRVKRAQSRIFEGLNEKQKEFLDFVLSKYIETGVGELSQDKLPGLLELKYHSISDATAVLGGITKTKELFVGFQEYLYAPVVA